MRMKVPCATCSHRARCSPPAGRVGVPALVWRARARRAGRMWLSLTRSGALARAATGIGIAGLPQRWGASSVIVVGIAGVVGVLVAMLAMGEGFKATLSNTGGTDTAIILRGGSQAETNSVITRDQVPLISALAGIARGADGRPIVSPELSQVVNLPSMADGTDANVQFRGVGPAGVGDAPEPEDRRRPQVRRRPARDGRRARCAEAVPRAGSRQASSSSANQIWTVVGVFESGDSHESELWADADVLGPAYQRQAFQSVTVKLDGKDGFKQLSGALAADPRLKLDVIDDARLLRQAIGKPDEVPHGPRHRDRHDHGDRRDLRRAQLDVRGGRGTCARDRDDARDRLPRPAGGGGGDAGDDVAGAGRRPARRGDRVAAVQRPHRVDAGQQLQPGRVPVPRLAGAAVDGPEVGAGHRPGRRPVPGAARGAVAGDGGVARGVSVTDFSASERAAKVARFLFCACNAGRFALTHASDISTISGGAMRAPRAGASDEFHRKEVHRHRVLRNDRPRAERPRDGAGAHAARQPGDAAGDLRHDGRHARSPLPGAGAARAGPERQQCRSCHLRDAGQLADQCRRQALPRPQQDVDPGTTALVIETCRDDGSQVFRRVGERLEIDGRCLDATRPSGRPACHRGGMQRRGEAALGAPDDGAIRRASGWADV